MGAVPSNQGVISANGGSSFHAVTFNNDPWHFSYTTTNSRMKRLDGDLAENLFMQLTGATKSAKSSDGDAVLRGHLVEIKQTGAKGRVTLNQVRAMKYIPVVVYNTWLQTWYVIPAHEVVRLVLKKRRGQHTENPFESAALSMSPDTMATWQVDKRHLGRRVMEAIWESDQKPTLKMTMAHVKNECEQTAAAHKARVTSALRMDDAQYGGFNGSHFP